MNAQVNKAKSLDELCEVLNKLTREQQDRIDFADLPYFDEDSPDNQSEVYSWDATRVLLIDQSWYIRNRCEGCNEATFHCKCK